LKIRVLKATTSFRAPFIYTVLVEAVEEQIVLVSESEFPKFKITRLKEASPKK
jgi:hypothetical protein